jgi:hypothetical protein|tara:strand:+ start:40 stop:576 length:537 start_codon:yes stop_codon:yes gene_type:complete
MSKNYEGYGNVMFKMKLLGFKDITTPRQKKNGTKIFKLPIKMYGRYIKVGSFKSGYVRRLECIGYRSDSSYQLNKRIESEPQYFKSSKKDSMGRTLYTQFTTRTCKLIPNEVDRLEYLVDYCLKNYYIKQANMIEDGKFVPKWKYDEAYKKGYDDGGHDWSQSPEVKVIINGQKYNIT